MQKKLFIIVLLASIITSCCNNQCNKENTSEANQESNVELTTLTVSNFDDQAPDYVGKEIKVSGLVNHTCKHSGKRMFIVEEGTENSVKIEAGEKIDRFDAELEGSEVVVTGLITELIIDEAYLLDWEAEIKEELSEIEADEIVKATEEKVKEPEENEKTGGKQCEKADEEGIASGFEKIENLRKQIVESGTDHLSFYSVECISYEVIPPAEI